MKSIRNIFGLGLLALVLATITTCSNPLEKPLEGMGRDGFVRIYLGERTAEARTVQPLQSAVAGYRLTFAGPSDASHELVDLTGSNYTDVYLTDGTWTITAKAYKLEGAIGVDADEIASGSVSVNLVSGVVSGAAPSIMLSSTAAGNGTLSYSITLASGVSGYLKLWDISNVAVSSFGEAGVLTLSATASANFTLAAGRYIAETKLTNSAGNVAFRREVVDVWKDTTSSFTFAPAAGDFLNPNAVTIANRMDTGVYVGIISFDENVRELTTGGLIRLDAAGVSSLKNLMGNDSDDAAAQAAAQAAEQAGEYYVPPIYHRAVKNGTGLYYGVHKALANLTTRETNLPADLSRVYVVTFTDGRDQNSYSLSRPIQQNIDRGAGPIENQSSVSTADYRTYLSEQIASRTIKGQHIVAYSVGLKGQDVPDEQEADFILGLSKIASAGNAPDGQPYYKKLALDEWPQLESRFEAISRGLDITSHDVTFSPTIPGYEPGTKVRLTFDVQKAGATPAQCVASQKYIEGTMDDVDDVFFLKNITYVGTKAGPNGPENLGSANGAGPITGQSIDSNVKFTFNSLTGYMPTDSDPILQWYCLPGTTDWNRNSEYEPGGSMASSISQHSAVIYLVLDASTSLETDHVSSLRAAVKNFIDLVYNPDGNNVLTGTPLTINTWTDGSIASGEISKEYSFSATAGTTYYIKWNDSYQGNGTKTLDVKVSGYDPDGAAVFMNADSAYNQAWSMRASKSGSYILEVAPYAPGNTGTFAIRYSTSN